MKKSENCHCGSSKTYSQCCEPYITGKAFAPTAESLMRARYSAYVVGDIKFISSTHDPDGPQDFDENIAAEWSRQAEWLGLEIVEVEAGAEDDSEGAVEFIAKFKVNGKEEKHHEHAHFEKKNGRWYFTHGHTMAQPHRRSSPKIGRNDPCTCGSGKKYKKCCAA